MKRNLARRAFHLALLLAVVCSALFGAFDISSPFTQSAFADGYPGSYASCCKNSDECGGTKTCRDPTPNIEAPCNPPTKPGYCR